MKVFKKIVRWMLVILLVAELIFAAWYHLGKNRREQNRSKLLQVRYDLRVLQDAILRFREKFGSPPLTLEYLTQGEKPILKELPLDPFPGPDPERRTYYYYSTQDGHFAVYSCGPNGQNDSDIDNYLEATRVSRSLGSGEDPEDCDDIILSDLPIKDR